MAKKAAKKSAKKKPSKKAPKRSPKKKASAPAGTQRMLVSDAFPDRDPEIEGLILEYIEADRLADEAVLEAEDRRMTAHKALKAAVRAEGHDLYSSYDIEYVVELKHLDDKLKVRKRKKKEAAPGSGAATDEEPEAEAAE